MLEPRHEIINGGQVLNNFLYLTNEDATLTVNQQCVECTTGDMTDMTITLAPVNEMYGRSVTISSLPTVEKMW